MPRGTFTQPQSLRVEHWKEKDCQQLLENLGSGIYGTGETASDCLAVFPERQLAYGNNSMWMNMKLNERQSGGKVRVSVVPAAPSNVCPYQAVERHAISKVPIPFSIGTVHTLHDQCRRRQCNDRIVSRNGQEIGRKG